ncbi:MAG TPA: prolyl oligopeptidase family serine peptidase [Chitinophagaceae bacterium]|jgi:dipeptidyl aminopeptidase/acylaminoacyl peptidase|nr:prolyl oligopeptidase family serine peptidase [Chitinophagaceae bacterium]
MSKLKSLGAGFAIIFFTPALFSQSKDIIQPSANLVIQGIPDIPQSISQDARKYNEFRVALLDDWNPVKREMLIRTRFANTYQIHLVKNPGGARKQMTFFAEGLTTASYEPAQGNYFIFLKDVGGNEFTQIYRYDFNNGNVTLLTDGGRSQNDGMCWSNSGRQIAYGSTRRNGSDRDIYLMDPLHPESDKLLLKVNGGGWSVSDWSPDDKSLLVIEFISANESHLWLVNVESGEKTAITKPGEREILYQNCFFSKNRKGIYFTTDKDNEFARLTYTDLTSMKFVYLSAGINWDVQEAAITKDGKQIAFTVNEAGISKLYLFSTTDNKYKQLKNIPVSVINAIRWRPNSQEIGFNLNTANSIDTYSVDITTEKLTRWTESELGGMVADELSVPTLIKWKSFDQREISGFYYKANKKFTGKRPLIIDIHGGPEAQTLPGFIGNKNYFLNELGASIIFPNVRGSEGYGKTFLTLDNGMKREESVKDIGALLDWVARQPDIDTGRIMITGGSYGGYMTLACAVKYSDRIRCALEAVGISNFNTFLKNTESYRRDLRRVEYGDERDTAMAAFFDRIAPSNNAAKIRKPLFIVSGGNDPRVPVSESIQMAGSVQKNGIPVWFLEATDEGHGFQKKNNRDFLFYATISFIKDFLLSE